MKLFTSFYITEILLLYTYPVREWSSHVIDSYYVGIHLEIVLNETLLHLLPLYYKTIICNCSFDFLRGHLRGLPRVCERRWINSNEINLQSEHFRLYIPNLLDLSSVWFLWSMFDRVFRGLKIISMLEVDKMLAMFCGMCIVFKPF